MTFRKAMLSNAAELHALRRRSILELAPEGMPVEKARQWAEKGSVESMSERLHKTAAWVAELEARIVGWITIRDDYLDGFVC